MEDWKEKYEVALKDMRVIYPNLKGDAKLAVEHAFSELRESEDEKIMNDIMAAVENFLPYERVEEIRFYLNHQKEQRPERKPIEFCKDAIIDSALNDYCCKQMEALDKENGGKISFARLQHLAMDIYAWCNEQKPAELSEEDEMRNEYGTAKYIRRLKSLRPQPHWKPSEEQMCALKWQIEHKELSSWRHNDLVILYEQLKRL